MSQKALFVESAPNGPQVVRTKDVPTPGPGKLLVKVRAAGLNPVDYIVRAMGIMVPAWPAVLGLDGAGTVEDVGEGAIGFAKGDKVLFQGSYTNDTATFQQYALASAGAAAKLPPNVSLDEGASIPLTLMTASIGLYADRVEAESTKLTPPWEAGGRDESSGQPIVIFGGSTSVGQYAIQLAKLSGFSPIISTASPHNAAHLKSLGATHVVDRAADPAVEVPQLVGGDTPLKVVFSSAPDRSVWDAALELVSPGGTLIVAAPAPMTAHLKGKYKDRYIANVDADIRQPGIKALSESLYSKLTQLLEEGWIKPNRVEVLPDGLSGIPDGLKRMQEGKVSGVKLIAHPQETA